MKYVVWAMLVLLIVAHQDNWLWDDSTLVAGFLPIGLVFHVGISLAAAFTWYLATIYCRPHAFDRIEAHDPRPPAVGQEGRPA